MVDQEILEFDMFSLVAATATPFDHHHKHKAPTQQQVSVAAMQISPSFDSPDDCIILYDNECNGERNGCYLCKESNENARCIKKTVDFEWTSIALIVLLSVLCITMWAAFLEQGNELKEISRQLEEYRLRADVCQQQRNEGRRLCISFH